MLRSMADLAERRDAPRVSLLSEVTVELPTGREVSATALDISVTGLSVWAPGVAPRQPVTVRLELVDGSAPIVVAARVAREFESDGGSVWGLEFQSIDEATRVRLEGFVHQRG
jgi:c-di-GMP-binding flagellar brake protein YcgR